jgi:hypothetical protein
MLVVDDGSFNIPEGSNICGVVVRCVVLALNCLALNSHASICRTGEERGREFPFNFIINITSYVAHPLPLPHLFIRLF